MHMTEAHSPQVSDRLRKSQEKLARYLDRLGEPALRLA